MTSITSEDLWRISLIVTTIWTFNGIVIYLLLTRVDTIVNVQLYEYGLQFSNNWADPYWASIHLIIAFIAFPIVLSCVVFVLGLARFTKKVPNIFMRKAKQQAETQEKVQVPMENGRVIQVFEDEVEDKQMPISTSEPQPELIQPEIVQVEEDNEPEKVAIHNEPKAEKGICEEPKAKGEPGLDETCPNCGRVFIRPLVVLGFTNGKARLLKTCPFCNHILGEALDLKRNDEKSKV